ncbi:hypothetical protein HOA92_01655 [archaeon]|jgi:hypothetical protein|nr:hypothetical protein [archaeon]MBT6761718.1 hypothetical protein [archaeon]
MDFNGFDDSSDSKIVYGSLVHEAYSRLWPEKDFSYSVVEEYNRRLGSFNANISLRGSNLSLKYNLNWKKVDNEIQIGLIQHLLIRMLAKTSAAKKQSTFNISLYNNFCKQIPTYVSEDHDLDANCLMLRESFSRVNSLFFEDALVECKLKWGAAAFRRLASYNFNNDSITVSSVFRNVPLHVLDLLMYHEMLHKQMQFDCKNGRVRTHTPEFKRRERLYPNFVSVEKEIDGIIRVARRASVRDSRIKKFKRFKKPVSPVFKRIQDFFG